jgi:hypothetical protein
MAKKTEVNGVKYWVDGEGVLHPEKYVSKEQVKRDAFVNTLVAKAKAMQKRTLDFKAQTEAALLKYLGDLARRNGTEWAGGTTIYSFSGDAAIAIKVAKRWVFGPELQLAKQKIEEFITNRSGGSDLVLVSMVRKAFKVDKSNQTVDPDQMRSLKDIDCKEPLWLEAMDLIRQSEKLIFSKTYYYFQEADESGQLVTIPLDFSSLQVASPEGEEL